jgi:hypothetical protein
VAVQPDPYFAFPSLYGAPAYSRPPRPTEVVARPVDPDDLPLARHQTEQERQLAEALLASGGRASTGLGSRPALPGGGNAGYQASGNGDGATAPGLRPRRLTLRGLADRIRTRA